MASKHEPESFEVTEYGEKVDPKSVYSVVAEIVQERIRDNPATAIMVSFMGDLLKVYYQCYEMQLPRKMKEVEEMSSKALDDAVKYIKKEYKKRAHHDLKLKEKKDMRDYAVQKVSLNERYYFNSWRFFEIE